MKFLEWFIVDATSLLQERANISLHERVWMDVVIRNSFLLGVITVVYLPGRCWKYSVTTSKKMAPMSPLIGYFLNYSGENFFIGMRGGGVKICFSTQV